MTQPNESHSQHPAERLLVFFEYSHLPDYLANVSRSFYLLAWELWGDAKNGSIDQGPEFTTALRKLLEAKDCAVRAALVAERER